MKTELRLYGTRNFSLVHGKYCVVKFRYHLSSAEFPKSSGIFSRRTRAVFASRVLKGNISGIYLFKYFLRLFFGIHQNMTCVDGILRNKLFLVLLIVLLRFFVRYRLYRLKRFCYGKIDKHILFYLCKLRFEFRRMFIQILLRVKQHKLISDKLFKDNASSFGIIVILSSRRKRRYHLIYFRFRHANAAHGCQNSVIHTFSFLKSSHAYTYKLILSLILFSLYFTITCRETQHCFSTFKKNIYLIYRKRKSALTPPASKRFIKILCRIYYVNFMFVFFPCTFFADLLKLKIRTKLCLYFSSDRIYN